MPHRVKALHRPDNWEDADKLLGKRADAARPLFLGPKPAGLPSAETVVDLSRLGLAFVKREGGTLRIGALTPLSDLANSVEVTSMAGGLLALAARLSAHPGLRNIASIGGSLLDPSGPPEVLLALLALEAAAVTRRKSKSVSNLAVAEFLAGPSPLAVGEVLTEVIIPLQAGSTGAALERIGRTPKDEAILAAAGLLRIENGKIAAARVALAGASPHPVRLNTVERVLEGQAPTADLLEKVADAARAAANPTPDFRASAEYRREMAGVLVKRAVSSALDQVSKGNQRVG